MEVILVPSELDNKRCSFTKEGGLHYIFHEVETTMLVIIKKVSSNNLLFTNYVPPYKPSIWIYIDVIMMYISYLGGWIF